MSISVDIELCRSCCMWKFLLIALIFNGCKLGHQTKQHNSDIKDIFIEDQSESRRRKATNSELMKVVKLKGCTGHLLHPDYMMTAAHCKIKVGDRYSSGWTIANQSTPNDITIAEITENNTSLDYVIAKISWANGFPEDQKFTTMIATSPNDVSYSALSDQGDEIITIGYAADKASSWGATYAEGRLKRLSSVNLYYNAGIINGNSGGGVWKKDSGMLVSLTNGGPHSIGQSGWNSSSKDDSSAWNRGVAMWVAYENSPKLKELFPNGRSILSGQVDAQQAPANASSSKIFLALKKFQVVRLYMLL